MLPLTVWKESKTTGSGEDTLARELGINPLISRILANRGICNADAARKFLFPSLKDLHNPFTMKDMEKGVERTISAITQKEKIYIYGDYDADGITATVAMVKFLGTMTDDIAYYIPDRLTEGYGLNRDAIDRMHRGGAKLVITVDCGVSDLEEVAYAASLGMDVVILDHHEIPDRLPDAAAIINPHQPDCSFPFKHLAGVGVVFNFLIALRGTLRNRGFWRNREYPNLRQYLDLVALGTIGDLVPLIDENRIFARIGLDIINENRRVGLNTLKMISGFETKGVDSEAASFSLIPKINAAGRLGSPADSVRLLLSDDAAEAFRISALLDSHNRERQEMERTILEEILHDMETRIDLDRTRSLVFASYSWHPGIIGIVASKLVNRYYRPTVLISLQDGIGRGSGRSISEFNLYEGLKNACSSLLISYGGHRYAAGITIREEDIERFTDILNEEAGNCLTEDDLVPKTLIDAYCDFREINYALLSQIELLAPFGNMNPEPVLCTRGTKVHSPTVVGNNHLKMNMESEGFSLDSIWFSRGYLFESLPGATVDVVFTPQINRWNGGSTIQLKVKDLALH